MRLFLILGILNYSLMQNGVNPVVSALITVGAAVACLVAWVVVESVGRRLLGK